VTERPARPSAAAEEPTVFVVDDDESMREALRSLFRSVKLRVETFGSTADFLRSKLADVASCLVLDVRLPGISGLDFQTELAKANIHIPIIFMTGHGDIPMSVKAMKAGAIDFLTKPVDEDLLLEAIGRAEREEANARHRRDEMASITAKLATLTPREAQVLTHVIAGRLNKQIAGELGTVEKTIKVHRGRMMEKLGVRSVADLVRLTERAGIRPHGVEA
jgi:FixJ family two-component response regulator